jgi:hypothetical protein
MAVWSWTVITVNLHHQASFMHIRIRHERCLMVNKMFLEELEQFDPPHYMCTQMSLQAVQKVLSASFSHDCPFAHPKCVWWCPYTSWSCSYRLWVMLQAHNKPNIGLDVCDKPETWFIWVQSVFGHHPSFLRKWWIRPRADRETKKQVVPLYCMPITTMCT